VRALSEPCRKAIATAAVRVVAPSFARALPKWKLTVRSLNSRMRAVSQLVFPKATQYRQAASRGDKGLIDRMTFFLLETGDVRVFDRAAHHDATAANRPVSMRVRIGGPNAARIMAVAIGSCGDAR